MPRRIERDRRRAREVNSKRSRSSSSSRKRSRSRNRSTSRSSRSTSRSRPSKRRGKAPGRVEGRSRGRGRGKGSGRRIRGISRDTRGKDGQSISRSNSGSRSPNEFRSRKRNSSESSSRRVENSSVQSDDEREEPERSFGSSNATGSILERRRDEMNGYFVFQRQHRSEMRKHMSNATEVELNAELKQQWEDLPQEEKEKYKRKTKGRKHEGN